MHIAQHGLVSAWFHTRPLKGPLAMNFRNIVALFPIASSLMYGLRLPNVQDSGIVLATLFLLANVSGRSSARFYLLNYDFLDFNREILTRGHRLNNAYI